MDSNKEQRASGRKNCDENATICFFLSAQETKSSSSSDAITAIVVDISATGMGIATDTMLRKGQIVQFDQDQPKWGLPEEGLIVWSFKGNTGYRTGIEFIA